jgi:hypothetical protein
MLPLPFTLVTEPFFSLNFVRAFRNPLLSFMWVFLGEIGATGLANPVPPGFLEETLDWLTQASILCPFS